MNPENEDHGQNSQWERFCHMARHHAVWEGDDDEDDESSRIGTSSVFVKKHKLLHNQIVSGKICAPTLHSFSRILKDVSANSNNCLYNIIN